MRAQKHVLVALACVLAGSLTTASCNKNGNSMTGPTTGVPGKIPSVPTNIEFTSPDGLTTIKLLKTAPGLGGSAPIGAEVFIDLEATQRGNEYVSLDFTIVDVCDANPGTLGRRSTVFQVGRRANPGTWVLHMGWRVSQT